MLEFQKNVYVSPEEQVERKWSQTQSYFPSEFTHVADEWHVCVWVSHSSTSWHVVNRETGLK